MIHDSEPSAAPFSGAANPSAETAQRRPTSSSALRPDTYLKSMLLGLIEDSYMSAGSFTAFAAEVLEVLVYAVTVPVAFTEGFLKAYMSVERVVEDADGRITIIPHRSAKIEEVIKDADAILAKVDGDAVFDPIVRSTLESSQQLSRSAMTWDLDQLAAMNDEQLMNVLREMQATSERERAAGAEERDEATDHIRARIATIRRNMQQFVDRYESSVEATEAGGDRAPGAAAASVSDEED